MLDYIDYTNYTNIIYGSKCTTIPDYIKHLVVLFTIICIIVTIITGLIARKTRSKTNNDKLCKIFYIMLIISVVLIEVILCMYDYL